MKKTLSYEKCTITDEKSLNGNLYNAESHEYN